MNYSKYIVKIKSTINHRKERYHTPLGKITVIKTFIISQLIHLFSVLSNPDTPKNQEITKMIFKENGTI